MKKTLLLIITLLFCAFSYAQITVEESSKKTLDEMLKNIDKSDLTSGILLDRSGNFSNLLNLNLESSKPINYGYFKQALLDLYLASNKKKFISSKGLKDDLKKNKTKHHIVDIGLISVDYQSLNYNPNNKGASGLKFKKNNFTSIKNKKPFLNHTSFVASPLKIAAKGGVITYRFQKKFWFNSSGKSIKSLNVSFENGDKYTVIKDNKIVTKEIQQKYSHTGKSIIAFKAVFSDGTSKICRSNIHIIVQEIASRASSGCIENDSIIADQTEAFQGYDENSPIRGKIDYRIYFRTNGVSSPCNLIKPIIIIDGFDPQDKRRIEDSDCANDPDCVALYDGYFSDEEHRSIEDLMQPTDGSQNLIPRLTNLGYDVIIVNHPTYQSNGLTISGGADYIERNALTLTRLIRDVNTRVSNNDSNEQLVIVGPSMGGQISRYALAYMEKMYAETNQPQWQHNTRLWISVDSPHLGANIPIGLQAVLNQLARKGNDGAQDFLFNQLYTPAAKQQLIEQFKLEENSYFTPVGDELDARTVSQGYSSSRGAPFFQTFYNSLYNNGLPGSKGYPQNLRKIALVNGSMSGSRDYLSFFSEVPSGKYVDHSEQVIEIKAFIDIPFTTHVGSTEVYFKPNTNNYGKISRYFNANEFYNVSLYMTNNNSRGNMDNIPGGWYPAQWEFTTSAFRNRHEVSPAYIRLRNLKDSHSFIPSFSAIGYTNPETNWAQALDKNLVCQNLTPFDSYFGHDKNTQHTSFNEDSVPWLLAELNGNALEPNFPINPDNLVGSWLMCNNLTRTYTFNSCSTPGDVVNWEVGGGMQIVSSTANSITVHTPRGSGGQGYIRAHFSNGSNVQKDIWIGPPGLPTGITGPSVVKPGFIYSYQGGVSKAAQSYQWELPSPFTVTSTIDMSSMRWNMAPTTGRYLVAMSGHQGADGYIKMRGWNNCGLGHPAILAVEHEPHDSGDPFEFQELRGGATLDDAIYPNPANTNLTIRLKEFIKGDNFKVILTDITGKVLLSKNYSQELINLDTSKFKNGYYILKIITKTSSMTKKIIIQH